MTAFIIMYVLLCCLSLVWIAGRFDNNEEPDAFDVIIALIGIAVLSFGGYALEDLSADCTPTYIPLVVRVPVLTEAL